MTQEKTRKTRRDYINLYYTIVLESNSHVSNFKIYRWDVLEDMRPGFHKKGSGIYPDPTFDLQEAEVFVSGDVKWDGCSNWLFEVNTCGNSPQPFHFCYKDEVVDLGTIMATCWDLAKEEMALASD